jgi:hypothetical protein
MRGKREERIDNLSPGPGAYDSSLHMVKDSVRQFKMGTSTRVDVAPKTAREMPGPGQY